jgi:hypothetical protein
LLLLLPRSGVKAHLFGRGQLPARPNGSSLGRLGAVGAYKEIVLGEGGEGWGGGGSPPVRDPPLRGCLCPFSPIPHSTTTECSSGCNCVLIVLVRCQCCKQEISRKWKEEAKTKKWAVCPCRIGSFATASHTTKPRGACKNTHKANSYPFQHQRRLLTLDHLNGTCAFRFYVSCCSMTQADVDAGCSIGALANSLTSYSVCLRLAHCHVLSMTGPMARTLCLFSNAVVPTARPVQFGKFGCACLPCVR